MQNYYGGNSLNSHVIPKRQRRGGTIFGFTSNPKGPPVRASVPNPVLTLLLISFDFTQIVVLSLTLFSAGALGIIPPCFSIAL